MKNQEFSTNRKCRTGKKRTTMQRMEKS